MARLHLAESQEVQRAQMQQATQEIARALRATADLLEKCPTTRVRIDLTVEHVVEAISVCSMELCFGVRELAEKLGIER